MVGGWLGILGCSKYGAPFPKRIHWWRLSATSRKFYFNRDRIRFSVWWYSGDLELHSVCLVRYSDLNASCCGVRYMDYQWTSVGRWENSITPAADQPVAAIGADGVLVAERGDREVDQRHLALAGLGFGRLHGPARIAVLLAELGRLGLPVLGTRPSLSACFSALVLRCLGAATRLASRAHVAYRAVALLEADAARTWRDSTGRAAAGRTG